MYCLPDLSASNCVLRGNNADDVMNPCDVVVTYCYERGAILGMLFEQTFLRLPQLNCT